MVERGARVGCFTIDHWFDCGTQEALLATNRHLLDGKPQPDPYKDAVVLPPVHIESSAEISGSVIGPYVSVGAGAKVEAAVIRNSILGEQATVKDVVLENSIVGFQAAVLGSASCLNVGDLSEIRQ
jgi:glucose-1-phosphate thymidylyltransferase